MDVKEAWAHVRALWPDAQCIVKNDGMLATDVVKRGDSIDQAVPLRFAKIDWPDEVTRYPESA
jgi:hypothetical protein